MLQVSGDALGALCVQANTNSVRDRRDTIFFEGVATISYEESRRTAAQQVGGAVLPGLHGFDPLVAHPLQHVVLHNTARAVVSDGATQGHRGKPVRPNNMHRGQKEQPRRAQKRSRL